jgi:hypothetical protein
LIRVCVSADRPVTIRRAAGFGYRRIFYPRGPKRMPRLHLDRLVEDGLRICLVLPLYALPIIAANHWQARKMAKDSLPY